MIYEIKRGSEIILQVEPEGNLTRRIMAESLVNMTFETNSFVEFMIGDTVEVYGEIFYLQNPPQDEDKESRNLYRYSLQFYSSQYILRKAEFFSYDENNTLKEPEFTIMANASTLLNLLLKNINRIDPGWTIGVVDNTEAKNLTFKGENCMAVLSRLANEFKTEWWIGNKVIYLTKKGADSGLSLEYGKNKGFRKISRRFNSEKRVFTVLYVFGSDKNLPGDYKGYSKRLKLNTPLEKNVDKYGRIEHVEFLDDIFPKREGTVTGIIDNFTFIDNGINFDINNCLIPTLSPKISFTTGQLAGYDFEIAQGGYNHTAKSIKINVNKDEKAIAVPSDLMHPQIGDKYIIKDLIMPEEWTTQAETDLATKGQEMLDEGADPWVNYTVVCDPFYFKRENIKLKLGDYVHMTDNDFKLDKSIRVVAFTRSLQDAYDYTSVEIADSVQVSPEVSATHKYKELVKSVELGRFNDVNRRRMSYKTVEEALNMVFDPDGYFTDKIRPLSIETSMLAVATKSQQFILRGVLFSANYQSDVNKFASTAGFLDHYAISDDQDFVTWGISAQVTSGLTDTKAYYIYAMCSKSNNTGEIILSESQIKVDEVNGYYHFLIGNLHKAIDNVRIPSYSYGYSTTAGGFIKTGKIESNDGQTYFDLNNGEIGGRIKFLPGSSGYENLSDKPDLSQFDVQTIIDGGLITSGGIRLGNSSGVNAGIDGSGTDGTSIRGWAGAPYSQRHLAPFRYTQNGAVYMSNAVIQGELTAGKVGGFIIDGTRIQNGDSSNFMRLGTVSVADEDKELILSKGTLSSSVKAGLVQLRNKNGTCLAIDGGIYVVNGDYNGFGANMDLDIRVRQGSTVALYGGGTEVIASDRWVTFKIVNGINCGATSTGL